MESLAGVAMKQKVKNKIGPFGFNKTDETQEQTEEKNHD